MKKPSIRKAQASDFHAFSQIYPAAEAYYHTLEPSVRPTKSTHQLKKIFKEKRKNYLLIAQVGKEVAGYMESEFIRKYKRGYISDIFVMKKFRKQGIATQMKNAFLKELRKRNYKQLALDVNTKNPALQLYKQWGLQIMKYRMVQQI